MVGCECNIVSKCVAVCMCTTIELYFCKLTFKIRFLHEKYTKCNTYICNTNSWTHANIKKHST